ncbi:PREDICTED: nucleolar protein 12-like [Polistes dominula]|uniref:Nucleolar protein 12-like n=1 Tax=Polistes dominula TaxID=743375 RepID=A0ABM1IIE8_POLDO|nr:PREDICTED: nucleolar protein 12-like [Polistes dominula]
MTKVKSNSKAKNEALKKPSKLIKDNAINKNKNKNKNKNNKFVNTPTGKVRLVNDKKAQNNQNNVNQSNKQKPKKNLEAQINNNNNNASPQKNKNKSNKQLVKNNKNLSSKKSKLDESLNDTSEDVTECDSSSISANDSNINIKDILGKSLADSTDEDDTDFVEDEEPDEDEYEYNSDADNSVSLNKGVKMFKGIQNIDDEDDDDDDDDDDDEEDEDEEDDSTDDVDDESDEDLDGKFNLKANTKKSKALNKNTNNVNNKSFDFDDDSEDDEDFMFGEDEYDEIEFDEDDDEGEDDDDDDDDDDEDEDDEEEEVLGLKALLANSIATDDDDDEDFKEEDEDDEDIDISDESDSDIGKTHNKKKVSNITKDNEEQSKSEDDISGKESRTIFVSNIPKETKKEEVMKAFKKFGAIESIRARGIIPKDPKMPKKVAAIKKKYDSVTNSIIMYIVFKSNEGAKKATSMNGKQFKGNYLKVDYIKKDLRKKPDEKKAVFLGNLPFTIEDNDLWKHFKPCGKIHSVRIIRSKTLGKGKGIGYINFINEDSVALALELNGSTLLDRKIRVQRYSLNDQNGKKLKRSRTLKNQDKPNKKFKSSDSDETTSPKENNNKKLKTKKNKLQKGNNSPNKSEKVAATTFQGQKATLEKKKKKKKSKPNHNLLKV